MHGGGEEEALVQAKMDPCVYEMALHYVASVCKFGADLTCFSASDRSLAGRVLVAVRCLGCKLACSLRLFPLPLAWCALHPWLPPPLAGELAGRAAARLKGGAPGRGL